MRIAFDLDGVLVDFVLGFTTLANEMCGSPVYSTSQQTTWEKFEGLSDRQIDSVWNRIGESDSFWFDLKPLATQDERLSIGELQYRHDVYFVTSRRAYPGVKRQTEEWLKFYARWDWPTVVMTNDKAGFCNLVRADAIIEDRPKNALSVLYQCKRTKVFLMHQPYNLLTPEAWKNIDEKGQVRRVYSIGMFLDALEGMK